MTACTAKISSWSGTFGSSAAGSTLALIFMVVADEMGNTSHQSSDSPDAEWNVVQRFHPDVQREPTRWSDEELIGVCLDVEGAGAMHERWYQVLRI
jgi:hypothetical protein